MVSSLVGSQQETLSEGLEYHNFLFRHGLITQNPKTSRKILTIPSPLLWVAMLCNVCFSNEFGIDFMSTVFEEQRFHPPQPWATNYWHVSQDRLLAIVSSGSPGGFLSGAAVPVLVLRIREQDEEHR